MMLAIFEPHSGGHRADYVRWTAEGLRAANHAVLLGGSSEMLMHPALQELLRSDNVHSVSLEIPGASTRKRFHGLRLLWRQLQYRSYFSKLFSLACRQHKLDGVVVPYLDYCLYAFAALGAPFGRISWCGITMRMDSDALERRASPQAFAMRLLCRAPTLKSVFTIDPRYSGQQSAAFAGAYGKLLQIGDPVEELATGNRRRIRLELRIPDEAVVVLVFGTLDSRKGIEHLLLGMLHSDPAAPITALLVGRQTSTIHALLSQPRWQALRDRGGIISLDRYVPNSDIADLFAGADAAWLGYVGHQHTSGVFILAAAAGLPIIATRVGAIGFLADRVSLSTKVSQDNPREVADALNQVANLPRIRRDPDECRQVAAAHSPAQFGLRIAAQFEPAQRRPSS
jgi:glycosyltransferase involved in cell wall biosynthesis